ncbi:hypothetical protein [Sporosarcina sp. 6E9]|uniref:hypothetical protein n=1 Tax=Sporosarcina sp. 6E9 TaxID=2819235 RepID=UPI001B30885B|nr:hypothetical protein [Sporosarcina sp. 6E9]
MSGGLIRLRLILKLWFTSVYSICVMLLIPIVAIVIYNQGSYTVEDLLSIFYEEAAPIWFVVILQWCLSIDFDSKFHMQVITYPIARWKFLLERLLFSTVIFIGLLIVVTLSLTSIMGFFIWQSLAFTIPIYIAVAGLVVAGTVIANHSVGGLLAGILFWMFYEFGGLFLGDLNVILIKYGSVYTFVKGETGFFANENHWILYNRLFYMGIGVLLTGIAILQFNRKTV